MFDDKRRHRGPARLQTQAEIRDAEWDWIVEFTYGGALYGRIPCKNKVKSAGQPRPI